MAIETTGDKVLSKAQLSFDPKSKNYRLEGTDAESKPIVFVGSLDDATHTLTLDRENPPKGSRQGAAQAQPQREHDPLHPTALPPGPTPPTPPVRPGDGNRRDQGGGIVRRRRSRRRPCPSAS